MDTLRNSRQQVMQGKLTGQTGDYARQTVSRLETRIGNTVPAFRKFGKLFCVIYIRCSAIRGWLRSAARERGRDLMVRGPCRQGRFPGPASRRACDAGPECVASHGDFRPSTGSRGSFAARSRGASQEEGSPHGQLMRGTGLVSPDGCAGNLRCVARRAWRPGHRNVRHWCRC